jgi:hypothetical protein
VFRMKVEINARKTKKKGTQVEEAGVQNAQEDRICSGAEYQEDF